MITGLGMASAVLGTAIAYLAARRPQSQEAMETVGGILLLAGLALLGYALQSIVGRP